MQHLVNIALGGAAGSVMRYLISTGTYHFFGRQFPYGTFAVNAIGAFVMGFLSVFLLERFDGSSLDLRSLLLIGFLGGFTTFSAFSFETFELMRSGLVREGLINIFVSVFVCLVLVWVGVFVGKKV